MTAKERAKKIVEVIGESISKPYRGGYKYNIEQAKKCALISVDLVINNIPENIKSEIEIFSNPMLEYWQEVKKEIELL